MTLASIRLKKELVSLENEPVQGIYTKPDEDNILHWYFLIVGAKGTDFEGGEYFGMIMFPQNYPFKPPDFKMFTPSGRFVCNQKICLSMSGFHAEEWSPLWSVSSMLIGLLSVFTGEEVGVGLQKSSSVQYRQLAKESIEWNKTFPEYKSKF